MSVGEVEVMAKRSPREFGRSVGFGNRLHLVPSHFSMIWPRCAPKVTLPTAQASVEEMSTTPWRSAVSSPLIRGAAKAVHVVPLKCIVESPTAQMSVGEDADAAKMLLLALFPLGVGTT